jgi:hypothetical protein
MCFLPVFTVEIWRYYTVIGGPNNRLTGNGKNRVGNTTHNQTEAWWEFRNKSWDVPFHILWTINSRDIWKVGSKFTPPSKRNVRFLLLFPTLYFFWSDDASKLAPSLQPQRLTTKTSLQPTFVVTYTQLSIVRFQSTIWGLCNVLKAPFLVVWNRVDKIVLKIKIIYCKRSSIKVISQP